MESKSKWYYIWSKNFSRMSFCERHSFCRRRLPATLGASRTGSRTPCLGGSWQLPSAPYNDKGKGKGKGTAAINVVHKTTTAIIFPKPPASFDPLPSVSTSIDTSSPAEWHQNCCHPSCPHRHLQLDLELPLQFLDHANKSSAKQYHLPKQLNRTFWTDPFY